MANLIYRDGLFPRTEYRRCWEALEAAQPRAAACRTMVGLLWLAHDEACEADLACALAAILDDGALPDLKALTERFKRPAPEQWDVHVTMPAAASYDDLIAAQGAAA